MAKSDITGKRKVRAQNVSHSNIKTKRWQNLNIQTRRVWVPEAGRFLPLHLATRDIRPLHKIYVVAFRARDRASVALAESAFLLLRPERRDSARASLTSAP